LEILVLERSADPFVAWRMKETAKKFQDEVCPFAGSSTASSGRRIDAEPLTGR
jgi:hypothetical protein